MPIKNPKEYPENWKEISSRIRFTRAQNKCEICNAENYKPHPITGKNVILSVAHINRNTTDNSDENLKALCQYCHLNHDRTDNKLRKKYGRKHSNQSTLFDEPVSNSN